MFLVTGSVSEVNERGSSIHLEWLFLGCVNEETRVNPSTHGDDLDRPLGNSATHLTVVPSNTGINTLFVINGLVCVFVCFAYWDFNTLFSVTFMTESCYLVHKFKSITVTDYLYLQCHLTCIFLGFGRNVDLGNRFT